MKIKSLLTAALMCCYCLAANAQSDAISTYFSKYVEDPEFTVVYISGKMFNLMESLISTVDPDELNDEQTKALAKVVTNMKGLRILTTDKQGLKHYEEAKKKMVGAKSYEVLMTVREKNKSKVDFYTHSVNGGDKVDELLLLVGQVDGNFVLLSFVGNVDMASISELAKSFDENKPKDKTKM